MILVPALLLIASISLAEAPSAPGNDELATVADPNRQLDKELARLVAMKMELEALERAPLPAVAPVLQEQDAKSEGVNIEGLPESPLPGAEGAYADTLYALGRFEKARKVYQKLAESEAPPSNNFAWAYFQLGNCARKTGDYVSAISAYENVMNAAPDAAWGHEAEWWAGHLKWLLVWNETMKNEGAPGTISIQ
jgi:tetratricopeptide (TPR) repeat protein